MAGAVEEVVYDEADVPARYQTGPLEPGLPLPILLFDDFSLSDATQLRHLDALEGAPWRRRGGSLVAQGVLRLPGEAGLADEGVSVRLAAVTDWCTDLTRGGVFLVTARAWYQLQEAALHYLPFFLPTRRKCELAARAAAVLSSAPGAAYDAVLPLVLAGGGAAPPDSGTLYGEAALLADARFLLAQLSAAVPAALDARGRAASFLGRLALACEEPPPLLPLKPPPRWRAADEAVVVAAHAAALAARMDWRGGLGGKRKRAAAARGPPPVPCERFGVEAALVGDLLGIWDAACAFAPLLRMLPAPLSRFTAALCPDGVSPGGPGGASGTASGAVLRDLHLGLTRLAGGRDPGAPPGPGRPPKDAAQLDTWPGAARAVVERAAADGAVAPEAAAAAALLRDCDYADLSGPPRLNLAVALITLAVEAEAVRDRVAEAAREARSMAGFALPWERPGWALDCAAPWTAWAAWAAAVAPAPGRPLGEDLEGRRYFFYGGATGWGRLFVLDAAAGADAAGRPCGAWGAYTWDQLPALAAWLEAGGGRSAAERALARLLRRAPPLPGGRVPAGWTLTAASCRVAAPGEEGVSEEGPDGYQGTVAPLLRGGAAGGAAGPDGVRACAQALLAAAPFWEQSPEWLSRFRLLRAHCATLGDGPDLGATLLAVEALLHQAGALLPAWVARRGAWQAAVRGCVTAAEAALPAAALQDHLVRDERRLTREAFGRACREAQQVAPLLPLPGQELVLSRGALRAHCAALGVGAEEALWAAMRPVERLRCEAVAFRRGDPAAQGVPAHLTVWALLAPAPAALTHPAAGLGGGLCVFACAGSSLPDSLVDAGAFDRSLARAWAPGDRFRIFLPSAGPEVLPGRRPGSFPKGTIVRVHLRAEVRASPCGARLIDVDPYEAYEVEWDATAKRVRLEGVSDRVCAWLLDAPEGHEKREEAERLRREDEDAAEVEAQARAATAARMAARSKAERGAARAVVPPPEPQFMATLAAFCEEHGRVLRIPTFLYAPLEVYRLFCEVQARGGYNAVCSGRRWHDIVTVLGFDPSLSTGGAFHLREHYRRLLLAFERRLGGEDDCEEAAAEAPEAAPMLLDDETDEEV